jgi:hypothetical protein
VGKAAFVNKESLKDVAQRIAQRIAQRSLWALPTFGQKPPYRKLFAQVFEFMSEVVLQEAFAPL